MYQALYRAWRPRSFDDVAGQEHITDILKNQISTGRISHAYLFIGARGTGKTTCAKLLARAINCESQRNGNPCNECPSCTGIESGEIMDVVELDAASNNGVDNVRALREEAVFSPVSVKKRVYIIDEAHMLSQSAFNALLKILEEPPEHLVFILATTELHKIPVTILSRCQRYAFRRIGRELIAARLSLVAEREGMDLTPGAARLFSRLADGSMRDALSLLDQCSGAKTISEESVCESVGLSGALRTAELLTAVINRDTMRALETFNSLWLDGKAPDAVLSEMCDLLRDTMLTAVAPDTELLSGVYDGAAVSAFVNAGKARLLFCMRTILQALEEIKTTRVPKTAAEICLVSLCEEDLSGDLPAILSRLERLEDAVKLSKTEISTHKTVPVSAYPPIIMEPEAIPPTIISIPDEIPPPVISDTNFLKDLYSALKGKLKIGAYNVITDPRLVSCELCEGELLIGVTAFAKNIVGTAEVSDLIKETAAGILGYTPALRFTEYSPKDINPSDKLDSLLKFGNVKQID